MAILPTFESLLQRLVAEPSVSSVSPEWDMPNVRVIDLLQEWFDQLGFTTEKLAIADHPGKFNLVATLGQGEGGLVLAGHTDTVPCDPALWHSDPFRLELRDGRFHGLGTCDMKGFFALVVEALKGIKLNKLRRPLVIVATADEESGMCGARALMESGRRLGRHAIIGEPTGLKPVRMHKGVAMEAVRIIGRAGHSSDPALGNNALEGMHKVLSELLNWRQQLQQRYRDPLFQVAVPTLNLGHIHGGDNPNRICGQCELHFDLRPLPGMSLDDLRAEVAQRLRARLADSGLQLEIRSLFPGVPPLETPAESAIVTTVEALTDHPAQAVAYATEGPFFNQMGLETVVLGPGSIEQAHQPNEYLALSQVAPGITLLNRLIHHFCA